MTGSDTVRSVITDRLIAQGIPVYIGESADQITRDTSLVVYTEGIVRNDEDHEDALRRNPETNAGLEKNIPVLSYPQALGEVFNDRYGVAIAGTHGKSTTTSLLGLVVQASHLPASTLTGTNLSQFEGTNYYTSGDQYFVIEACEHKRHFLNYHPQITIITNIEADHLDYYRDEDDYEQAFAQFMRQTSGAIILT